MVVVAMLGVGYALVPLYRVVGTLTGFNGKTAAPNSSLTVAGGVDGRRLVTLQVVANVDTRLPWTVRGAPRTLEVHPGRRYRARYVAENFGATPLGCFAAASVTPHSAAPYFHWAGALCDARQPVLAGATRELSTAFAIDRGLPQGIATITLSYTFYLARTPS